MKTTHVWLPAGTRNVAIVLICLFLTGLIACHDDELEQLATRIQALEADRDKMRTDAANLAGRVDGVEKELRDSVLRATLRQIPLNMSGSEVCADNGEACISVLSSEVYDRHDRFLGHDVVSCNSRLKARPRCMVREDGTILNYEIGPTNFRSSPKSDVRRSSGASSMCLEVPYYDSAVCSVAPGSAFTGNLRDFILNIPSGAEQAGNSSNSVNPFLGQ